MKEKIEALSNKEFEYEPPLLCLSKEEIRIEAIAGQVFEDSFTIKNSINRRMKGVIYSSNRLLTLHKDTFVGQEAMITYQFNAEFLQPGDVVEGEVTLVSDCGEYTIPFLVKVEAPYYMTSVGKVKDLSQFTSLARVDWSEAKKIFRSEDFENVILRDDSKYIVTYRNLLKSISTSQALEEFLILVNKKKIINITIDKIEFKYNVFDEEIKDKIILTKNHWGYAEIRVSTDAPYINLGQKLIWTDRFMGNSHHLSFTIDPKQMRKGKNLGRIFIKTVKQTIIVKVFCHKSYDKEEKQKISIRKMSKYLEYDLIRNYLDFRLNNIERSTYTKKMSKLLNNMAEKEDSLIKDLIRIHLALISGDDISAGKILDGISKLEEELKKGSSFEYCAYLYLLALYKKNKEVIAHATDEISRCYNRSNYDWRLLWFLLYIDKRYDSRKILKLDSIRELFFAGSRTPVLYYEAVLVYNEEPHLLREFSDFEIQVMNYGIKNKMLTRECVEQYTYLAGRMKNYHPVIFKGLTVLYEEYKEDQILSSICSMLIKGLKTSNRYFKWFKLGVEAQLRITGLYEYYIYSIDENTKSPLDEPVLLYFMYNSNINSKKKAFLYSNIIRNKETNIDIYRSYLKQMELFAMEQLESHLISRDLAVLYEKFFNHKRLIEDKIAKHLPQVCFTYELVCDNHNMVSVTVYHRELGEEKTTRLKDGRAIITRYNENVEIYFTDTYGYKYTVSVNYRIRPFINIEESIEEVASYNEEPMLLLHLYDRFERNRVLSQKSINIREKILTFEGLEEEYRAECLMSLIDYYFDNYEEDNLDNYLEELEIDFLRPDERIRFLEYLVVRGFYDKAIKILENFCFEDVSVNRLIRLCSGLLSGAELDTKQSNLLSLCHYIFTKGKYDEETLKYLVRFYYGPTVDMLSIWNAAKGFDIETPKLEERLLSAMLFAETKTIDSYPVFMNYYEAGNNRKLIRAYLTYHAYRYLVHNCRLNEDLFKVMRRELRYENNNLYLLAWLKHNSSRNEFSEDELTFIEISINNLEKQGIVLPFFLDYKRHIKLPGRLQDKVFIGYNTDPSKQVYIHYRLLKSDSEEFIIETMPNVLSGVHVKGFNLFYHEILQYYISEEKDGEETVSEIFHLQYDDELPEEASRYNKINLMLKAMQIQDDLTLLETMEEYVISEHIISKCFHPV